MTSNGAADHSLAPGIWSGTTTPSGKWWRTACRTASINGLSMGEIAVGADVSTVSILTRSLSMVDASQRRNSAASVSGSRRQSMLASACSGMTLTLYPALSIVRLTVSRSIAFSILLAASRPPASFRIAGLSM